MLLTAVIVVLVASVTVGGCVRYPMGYDVYYPRYRVVSSYIVYFDYFKHLSD